MAFKIFVLLVVHLLLDSTKAQNQPLAWSPFYQPRSSVYPRINDVREIQANDIRGFVQIESVLLPEIGFNPYPREKILYDPSNKMWYRAIPDIGFPSLVFSSHSSVQQHRRPEQPILKVLLAAIPNQIGNRNSTNKQTTSSEQQQLTDNEMFDLRNVDPDTTTSDPRDVRVEDESDDSGIDWNDKCINQDGANICTDPEFAENDKEGVFEQGSTLDSDRAIEGNLSNKNDTPAKSSLAISNDKFTQKVYSKILKTIPKDSNIVLSPFSLNSALTMTLAGARGETTEELKNVLDIEGDEQEVFEGFKSAQMSLNIKNDFKLTTSNLIFVQSGFSIEQGFVDTLSENFNSTPSSVDFKRRRQTVKKINDVVSQTTNGLIDKLLTDESVDPSTRLILVNAIHFKGDWKNKFNPNSTVKSDFQLSNGTKIQTEMMNLKDNFEVAEIPQLAATALRMPYSGDRLSMVVILPNKETGLEKTEEAIENFDLASIDFNGPEEVEVALPKFKLQSDYKLVQTLKSLEVTSLFDAGRANLTGISPERLSISDVIQKAVLEVNEQGSEAAAATAVEFELRSIQFYPVGQFKCDRPFMYFITDNLTGLTLFIGRVSNPNEK